MKLEDVLNVGGEVMTRIKIGLLNFDLRKRTHGDMIYYYEEAEEPYGVGWGCDMEFCFVCEIFEIPLKY